MKRNGNIRFTRRIVAFVGLLIVAVSLLMRCYSVYADSISGTSVLTFRTHEYYDGKESFRDVDVSMKYSCASPVYSFIYENITPSGDLNKHDFYYGFMSTSNISFDDGHFGSSVFKDGGYFYVAYWPMDDNHKLASSKSDIFLLSDCGIDEAYTKLAKYLTTGEKSDGMIIGGSDTHPTSVTNESIGYLQDVKLNLSYITPIKGDSIFETTNYQIYTDMIYNLKWNNKKTSTNYDLSSSYVQLYAKAEYSKSEYDKVSATDFIELGDYEKASKGKLKFSFMELFEKSYNCKSAYLSAFPLSSVDYNNGKLQACSVTPNIKYKFYIRVYKGTDKGPWLCVSEKGTHHSNEFVNSGVKVPFNVSSGDLDSDGTYKPDGNINENGHGITGTGTDKDDADADTNANDKIQTKHDSSDNSLWDNLENLVSGISNVPIIIKDIFSFLLSWCLNVTATGFALMITVCVIRFIRG